LTAQFSKLNYLNCLLGRALLGLPCHGLLGLFVGTHEDEEGLIPGPIPSLVPGRRLRADITAEKTTGRGSEEEEAIVVVEDAEDLLRAEVAVSAEFPALGHPSAKVA